MVQLSSRHSWTSLKWNMLANYKKAFSRVEGSRLTDNRCCPLNLYVNKQRWQYLHYICCLSVVFSMKIWCYLPIWTICQELVKRCKFTVWTRQGLGFKGEASNGKRVSCVKSSKVLLFIPPVSKYDNFSCTCLIHETHEQLWKSERSRRLLTIMANPDWWPRQCRTSSYRRWQC